MFDIEYKGANAIVFATKKVRVVFDPNLAVAGAKNVSVKDSVEVVTEDRFAVTDPAPRLLLNSPGEYEVGDVAISGIPARRHIDTDADGEKSTIYKISVGDVRGVVIGNIQPKLSDDQLEDIGMVDFAIIPVGGSGYTLDAVSASSMVRQLDPKVVIPVHYADSYINYEVPQAGVEDFMKELNANVVEAGLKWRLKKPADLPDSLTVVQISKT